MDVFFMTGALYINECWTNTRLQFYGLVGIISNTCCVMLKTRQFFFHSFPDVMDTWNLKSEWKVVLQRNKHLCVMTHESGLFPMCSWIQVWGLLLWHHRTFQTLLLSSRLFGFARLWACELPPQTMAFCTSLFCPFLIKLCLKRLGQNFIYTFLNKFA